MIDRLLKWFFFIQCQLLLLLVYSSEGFEGGADAVCHWMISRDAPSDPMLFLDQWNKPLFTVLSAPFAQFGLLGMRIFSALSGILTGIVLYRLSKKYLAALAWLPAILLLLLPQYFTLLTSSMTEPLFGLFLALFLLAVSEQRFGWAAIVAGILPFVRQEGMALIPIAAAVLVYARKARKLPLLALGTAVLAVVGWVVSGDRLWILTSFPYGSASSDIYGHGDLLHYLRYYKELFGIPITVVFSLGAVFLLGLATKRIRARVPFSSFELAILSAFAFSVLFFSAHSFIWWKGMRGSLGLIRVMACMAPAMALVAAFGISELLSFRYLRHKAAKVTVLTVFLAGSVLQLALATELPTPLGQAQLVMQQASNWLREQGVSTRVHYADPVFAFFAGNDLVVDSPINKGPITASQISGFPAGEYIVWDAHFSPNEGRLPLDSLLFHPYLERVRSFHPKDAFTVLGNRPYVIHVFRKTATPIVKRVETTVLMVEDFANASSEFRLAQHEGRQGSAAAVSDGEHPFTTIRQNLLRSEAESYIGFQVEAWIRSSEPTMANTFHLVSDINVDGQGIHYLSTGSAQIDDDQVGQWISLQQAFQLPQYLPDSFELKCYVWNPNGIEILVDDLRLEATSWKPLQE